MGGVKGNMGMVSTVRGTGTAYQSPWLHLLIDTKATANLGDSF